MTHETATASTGLSPNNVTLQDLLQKIEKREYRVGIVGLGYVGLPLMWTFHEKQMPVSDTRNAMNGKGTTKPGQVWKA